MPFEADQAFTYVAKVKNLLVGMAPTESEVQQVLENPAALKTLIDRVDAAAAVRGEDAALF